MDSKDDFALIVSVLYLLFKTEISFLVKLDSKVSTKRRPKTEDRRPKTEDRRPKTEDRRSKTEDRKTKSSLILGLSNSRQL